jgi:hypothetical protein
MFRSHGTRRAALGPSRQEGFRTGISYPSTSDRISRMYTSYRRPAPGERIEVPLWQLTVTAVPSHGTKRNCAPECSEYAPSRMPHVKLDGLPVRADTGEHGKAGVPPPQRRDGASSCTREKARRSWPGKSRSLPATGSASLRRTARRAGASRTIFRSVPDRDAAAQAQGGAQNASSARTDRKGQQCSTSVLASDVVPRLLPHHDRLAAHRSRAS